VTTTERDKQLVLKQQIKDGKVVEVRPFYWDTQELNAALG
jgi:hypothetical protein